MVNGKGGMDATRKYVTARKLFKIVFFFDDISMLDRASLSFNDQVALPKIYCSIEFFKDLLNCIPSIYLIFFKQCRYSLKKGWKV